MKLLAFSIKNYRSITTAYKVPLHDKSILIGPNNEGKSNILHGLVLSLETLSLGMSRAERLNYRVRLNRNIANTTRHQSFSYDWWRDFPIPLRVSEPNGSSEFTLEFELTQEDREDFWKKVGNKLSSNLILKLRFQRDISPSFDVIISGPAKKALKAKSDKISLFLRNHLNFQYIPAVRSTEYALNIVENLLAQELSLLEEKEEYRKLLASIIGIQKPILVELSKNLKNSINPFVPEVKSIEVNTSQNIRSAIRKSCRIFIDDGIRTDIEQKGDGIKSLIAISLVSHLSKKSLKNRNLILAIEEPESHLHPAAIQRLSFVLNEISTQQQVIITTHSPLLVDRLRIENNILVNKSRAKVAKNISQIREILGVQVSDNLSSANWVLLVEGAEDKIILKQWLIASSPELKKAFETNHIFIDDLQGGSNLSYKISQYKNLMCNVFAFLDHDSCAKESFEKAKSLGLISLENILFSSCVGRVTSELEDLIVPETYFDSIKNFFGVTLKGNRFFRNTKKVWSNRVREVFLDQGKPWDDKIEMEVKRIVSESAELAGLASLNTKNAGTIENLKNTLIEKMNLKK